MSLNLRKYLKLLRQNAKRLERTDINNNTDESFKAKYSWRIVFALISIILVVSIRTGFSESFVSFVSSVLSILIGLFATALIFSFDRFYKPIKSSSTENGEPPKKISSIEKLWDKQSFNFTKKFAYVTGYTIVMGIITLVLLAICALFNQITEFDIFSNPICFSCITLKKITWLKISAITIIAFVQRFLTFYFLQRITFNTLFIVSSMIQFMTVKLDKEE